MTEESTAQAGTPESNHVSSGEMTQPEGVTVGQEETGIVTEVPENYLETPENIQTQTDATPEWRDSKYASTEDQAKANNDAQKYIGDLKQRMGQFAEWKAPQEYDFKELGEVVDSSSPEYSKFVTFLRDNNVPQEKANEILGFFKNEVSKYNVDIEAEKAKMGPNAQERLDNITNWVRNSYTPETQEYIFEATKTAAGVKALQEMRDKSVQTSIDASIATPPTQKTNKTMIQEMVDNIYSGEEFAKNPDKAADWLREFQKSV